MVPDGSSFILNQKFSRLDPVKKLHPTGPLKSSQPNFTMRVPFAYYQAAFLGKLNLIESEHCIEVIDQGLKGVLFLTSSETRWR